MRIGVAAVGWAIAVSLSGPGLASDAEPRRDERMIVASDEMVITFDGSSVKVKGTVREARINLYMAKPDEHGAMRYGIDIEADCRRNMQREVASTGARGNGSTLILPADPGCGSAPKREPHPNDEIEKLF